MRVIVGKAGCHLVVGVGDGDWGGCGCCRTADVCFGAANVNVQRTVWSDAFDIQEPDCKRNLDASLTELFYELLLQPNYVHQVLYHLNRINLSKMADCVSAMTCEMKFNSIFSLEPIRQKTYNVADFWWGYPRRTISKL